DVSALRASHIPRRVRRVKGHGRPCAMALGHRQKASNAEETVTQERWWSNQLLRACWRNWWARSWHRVSACKGRTERQSDRGHAIGHGPSGHRVGAWGLLVRRDSVGQAGVGTSGRGGPRAAVTRRKGS